MRGKWDNVLTLFSFVYEGTLGYLCLRISRVSLFSISKYRSISKTGFSYIMLKFQQ